MSAPVRVAELHRCFKATLIVAGKLGTSLLQGLLFHRRLEPSVSNLSGPPSPSHSFLEISHICVTVRHPASVTRIQETLRSISAPHRPTPSVSILLQDGNGVAAQESDVVILGCKPSAFSAILQDSAVRQGLLGVSKRSGKRKVLVSILGGVSIAQLESCLYASPNPTPQDATEETPSDEQDPRSRCIIIRAIPNIAARIQESVTILSSPPASSTLSSTMDDSAMVVNALFSHLGLVKHLPESQFARASALAASSLAFYARVIAAAADGAMADGEGLAWDDALWIAAYAARGTSALVLAGEEPEAVVRAVATKGGSTMAGLEVMAQRGVEEAVREAIKECGRVTEGLNNARPG
ncbi:MAG: hypothetical protein Q9187_003249 [Circinaria calcarea]